MKQLAAYSLHDILQQAGGLFGTLLLDRLVRDEDRLFRTIACCTAASHGSGHGRVSRAGVRRRGGRADAREGGGTHGRGDGGGMTLGFGLLFARKEDI